jgi:hypothetical protein
MKYYILKEGDKENLVKFSDLEGSGYFHWNACMCLDSCRGASRLSEITSSKLLKAYKIRINRL